MQQIASDLINMGKRHLKKWKDSRNPHPNEI